MAAAILYSLNAGRRKRAGALRGLRHRIRRVGFSCDKTQVRAWRNGWRNFSRSRRRSRCDCRRAAGHRRGVHRDCARIAGPAAKSAKPLARWNLRAGGRSDTGQVGFDMKTCGWTPRNRSAFLSEAESVAKVSRADLLRSLCLGGPGERRLRAR